MKLFRADVADIASFISKRDINGLIAALKDNEKDIRWMAAGGLGELLAGEAVEPLIDLLSDRDPDVRWKAAESLGSIGDPRATEALIHLLGDPDETARLQALWALGKIRDRRATRPIVLCLSDGDQEIKTAAIWALGSLVTAVRLQHYERDCSTGARESEPKPRSPWKRAGGNPATQEKKEFLRLPKEIGRRFRATAGN
ncbi:HEAT repeat domain-containing protein [Methanoculleus sp. MH98A]|uniref:HEAT repeat domain-containing protein n=1 Tax=Methanoculleus sp. MH98A TaxID=1495314 RepID=UPI0004A1414A|nr:HEAT repeat domain-containing protein [Methanoculleus sp. MH98A]KDE55141.1 hypothetical protein EI28_08850 [Methanoculleus sp. MH98A]